VKELVDAAHRTIDDRAMSDPVLVSLPEEGSFVATVTINRPDKLNALNREVLERLTDAFE